MCARQTGSMCVCVCVCVSVCVCVCECVRVFKACQQLSVLSVISSRADTVYVLGQTSAQGAPRLNLEVTGR